MGILNQGIRLALNHLPRTFLQRVAGGVVPLLGIFYVGRGRECPICGCRRRRFLPYGYTLSREDALCPRCLSLERHRALWLYLQERTTLLDDRPTLLHIAPEVCLKRHLELRYKGHEERYLTADLESPLAQLHFDVQNIPLADESVDVVICNHLLEHVESDKKALAELWRILKHGGWGVILSPIDPTRETTDEDDGTATREERIARFGQYDHRRAYGRDYTERLRAAGFEVEDIDFTATIEPQKRELYALCDDHLYIVHKPSKIL